jgi:hypothetical protein
VQRVAGLGGLGLKGVGRRLHGVILTLPGGALDARARPLKR